MICILAIADGGKALEPVCAAAAHFAGLLGGQAHALHVRDSLVFERSGHGAFAIGNVIGDVLDSADQKAAARADAARKAYDKAAAKLPNPKFIDASGDESERVTAHGRLADLIVVGRPGADELKPEPDHVRAAIFESGRPVMVVPPQWTPGALAHAVVAWNGSQQVARALGAAVPFLHHAGRITVASAGKDDADGKAPDMGAAAAYLGRHGIEAITETFDAGSGSARARGRALISYVDEVGAGLLVMGAYGQAGMLRFLGLGGATAKVITGCPVPVLLAH
jgi:nucleotide-binding universal stress UspA family protein